MSKVNLYNESSEVYQRRYNQIQLVKYSALRPFLCEGPLLDVGVGTGIGIPSLLDLAPVIGVDGSIGMLKIAQQQLNSNIPQRGAVSLMCASAEALPFRQQIFSTVVSVTVLQNLVDAEKNIQEILMVIQESGVIGLTALAKAFTISQLEALVSGATITLASLDNLANEDIGLILQRR